MMMDDSVPAIVQDDSLDNTKDMDDPNATMDINDGHYPVIEHEDDDDQGNIQDPIVVTWFTFYSHREQREYYYEPVSGTTTWIAPSLTIYDTNNHNDDNATDDTENQRHSSSTTMFKNIISRLPGSPQFQESVRQHVQNAITVSNRIHQNQIVPIITKRHVAILLLVCNIALLYVWFRSGSGVDNQVVVLNTTKVTEATTIGNTSMIAVNAITTIQPSTQSGDDNASNESPSEPLHLSQVDETYPDDEVFSTTESILDNNFFDADVDSSTTSLAYSDVVPDEVVELSGSDVHDAVETTYDNIELPLNPSLSTSESMLNSYESPNSTIEDIHIEPGITQETIVDLDDKAVHTESQNKLVTAGTNHATKITPSVVLEPDRNLNVPDAVEPNVMVMFEAEEPASLVDEPGSLLIASDVDFTSSVTEDVEEPVDTENNTISGHTTEDDGIVVDERNNELSISNAELEAIQKEALMVVQRVGMTAINAGYMIELEPNFTTSNNTAESSRTLMADLLTDNHTWV